MNFRLLLIASLAILPSIGVAASPIEVKIESWPWKLPVPDGFCALDPTKPADKALHDYAETMVPKIGVMMADLVDCAELQTFRKNGKPPRHTL